MFTKQPTVDMDIEFDIKLLATEYFEGTVCIQCALRVIEFFFVLFLYVCMHVYVYMSIQYQLFFKWKMKDLKLRFWNFWFLLNLS